VLKTHMAEIRRALGDDIKSPRFIETAHRRGYRFIAALDALGAASPAGSSGGDVPAVALEPTRPAASSLKQATSSADSQRNSDFVGREHELQRLETSLSRALQGPLRAVFVTGEAGAGKTTLANEFLVRLEARAELQLARGQCVEQYGASEAYLPVLEALGRLCRESGKERIVEVLRRQAPSWLAQLPGVLGAAEQARLAATAGATPERMLREIADAVLSISEQRCLVLLLEDLHWADPSTLHLISYLARRSDPARVLLLGTYRQHEVGEQDHPLVSIQQDLQVSGRGEEIALGQLSEQALSEYLHARFAGHRFPAQLVQVLHERTSGSPLFLARLIDYWLEREWLVERAGTWQLAVEVAQLVRGVPTSLSRMIERELERLPEFERSVVDVASVVGVEFSVSTLAAALDVEVTRIEELCFSWARKAQFLRTLGATNGSDGQVSLRCAFAHGLYQQVAYERIGPARVARLHVRVGSQLEAFHAGSAELVASELALHFERGQAYPSAVRYLILAAERALSRSAYRETLDHVQRGLHLLQHLESAAERCQCELPLELMRGATLAMTRGFAAAEVEHSYARCRELCASLGERAAPLPLVLEGMWRFYLLRGDCRAAHQLQQQICALAEERQEPRFLAEAGAVRLATYCYLGRFREACSLAEALLRELEAEHATFRLSLYREDPRILVSGHLAWALWNLGYPDQALTTMDRAVALARQGGHPFTIASALHYRSVVLAMRRDYAPCLQACDEALQIATTYDFPLLTSAATVMRASSLTMLGQPAPDFGFLDASWRVVRAMGADESGVRSIWADSLVIGRRFSQALQHINETLADGARNGDHAWDPWLYHTRGEVYVRMARDFSADHTSAERDFATVLDLSRKSGLRTYELRAAMSLARLWQQRRKTDEARALLAPVLASFDEGWDTPDLREAAQLLAELSGERVARSSPAAMNVPC
jgi:predicted ATPase